MMTVSLLIVPIFLFVLAFILSNKLAKGRSIYQLNLFQGKVSMITVIYIGLLILAGSAYYGLVFLQADILEQARQEREQTIASEGDLVRLMNNIHRPISLIEGRQPYDLDRAEDYHHMGTWNLPWALSGSDSSQNKKMDLHIVEDGYKDHNIIVIREVDRDDIQIKAYKTTTIISGKDMTDQVRPPLFNLDGDVLVIYEEDLERIEIEKIGFGMEFPISQFQTGSGYWGGFEHTTAYSPTIIEIEVPQGTRIQNKTYSDVIFY